MLRHWRRWVAGYWCDAGLFVVFLSAADAEEAEAGEGGDTSYRGADCYACYGAGAEALFGVGGWGQGGRDGGRGDVASWCALGDVRFARHED